MSGNSRTRAEGWRPNWNTNTSGTNGHRPFEKRNEVPFKRPPAVYGNPQWDEMVDKYVAVDIPPLKTKKRKP